MKSTLTAIVFSMLLLAMIGCATSGGPSTEKQKAGKKNSTTKGITYDQQKQMNEESLNAVR
jgi:Flp pilus assembly protein TadD